VLGLAVPQTAVDGVTPPTASGRDSPGRAMLKARVKAAAEGRPPPRWGPPSVADRQSLATLLEHDPTRR